MKRSQDTCRNASLLYFRDEGIGLFLCKNLYVMKSLSVYVQKGFLF